MNDSGRFERPAAQLRRLWREKRTPDLADFVAKVGVLDAGELAAILRVDQSERWEAGEPVPAEDYLSRYPIVAADAIAAIDLIHNEYLLAERAGRPIDPEIFVSRFPAHIDTLRLQIELHRAMMPSTDGVHSTLSLAPAAANATLASVNGAADVPMGERFGEYELIELIARGGMGVVYKARQPKLDRIVALKMILAGHLASAGAVERFRTEAQSAARLSHPGIVPVFEIGEHQGQHYFTMAYVEGRSLADILHDGPLPASKAAALIRDLCAAIAYAHDHGIVHRDLKPANVILDRDGKSKLTDFGLAKRTFDSNQVTGTGEILGTPAYMSPEQATGGGSEIGPLADVYGLGALLFALTTGRPPFQAAIPIETIQHVVSVDPPRPRSLNPSIPRDLETICLKCLEKSPAKRYASATAIAADLDRFLNGQPILARPVGVIEKAYRWYRRRPVMGSMAVALLLLLTAIPILLASLWGEAEARAKAAAAGRVKEVEARKKIEAAEAARTRELFSAYVKEAAARRSSPKVGRRFQAIERIIAARELADSLQLPPEDYTRLRSEAISALSLVDIRDMPSPPGWSVTLTSEYLRYVRDGDSYIEWASPNALLIRHSTDEEVLRIPVEQTSRERNEFRISPDNRFVSYLDGNKLFVWQVDGTKPWELIRQDNVLNAWFAPDRPEIIVFSRNWGVTVRPLDDKGTSKTIDFRSLWQKSVYPQRSVLGPRSQLAIAGLKIAIILDLEGGKVTHTVTLPNVPDHMAWSPDGEMLAISSLDSEITLYRPREKTQEVVKGPLGGPVQLAFDPSGQFLLLAVPWTGHNSVLDVARRVPELRFHTAELAASGDKLMPQTSGVWWAATLDGIHRTIPIGHDDGLPVAESLAVHPDGRLLATPSVNGIVFSDLRTGQRLGFVSTQGACSTARFDGAGNLYAIRGTVGRSSRVAQWVVKRYGNRYTIGPPMTVGQPGVFGFDISKDGQYVAAAVSFGSLFYDRQAGGLRVVDTRQDLRNVAIIPDGSLVASFTWGPPGFRVWDAKSEKVLLSHPTGNLGRGRFTPDGKHLVTYGLGESDLLAWSIPDCTLAQRLGPLGLFAISPDSRYIAVTEPSGKIRLNRIVNGELIARFDAPGEDYLIDLAFSPDGRRLIGMNTERTRHHVWDLWKLRQQLRELKLDWETDPPPELEEDLGPITLQITPQTWWGPFIGPVSPRGK